MAAPICIIYLFISFLCSAFQNPSRISPAKLIWQVRKLECHGTLFGSPQAEKLGFTSHMVQVRLKPTVLSDLAITVSPLLIGGGGRGGVNCLTHVVQVRLKPSVMRDLVFQSIHGGSPSVAFSLWVPCFRCWILLQPTLGSYFTDS